MPDWREEVISALAFWINLEGGATAKPRWVRLGRLRTGAGPGWYTLDVRGRTIDTDQLDTLRIAGKDGQPDDGHPVQEVVQEGQRIAFKVADFVDIADAILWQYKQPSTYLLTKLRDGIRSMGDTGLGHDLAAGRLAAAPAQARTVHGFTPMQQEAFASCFAPGVRLVWGPPGTGKTRVLTEAIDELVKAGKRILLVSSTNIAVDNALLGVVRRGHPSGTLLRVGPPHIPEIAANKDVSLPHLVRDALVETETERVAVQDQLMEIRRSADDLARVEKEIAEFDPVEYGRIRRLIDVHDSIPRLAQTVAEAEARHEEHESQVAGATAILRAAEALWADAKQARAAYAEIARIAAELDKVRAATAQADEWASGEELGCELTHARLREAEAAPLLKRLLGRRHLKQLRLELAHRRRRAEEYRGHATAARERLRHAERSTQDRAAALRAEAGIDESEIGRRERGLADAVRRHEAAVRVSADAAARLSEAQAALLAAQAEPQPTPEQLSHVAAADRDRLPQKHAGASALRAKVAADSERRAELEQRHTRLQDRFEQLRKDAEGAIIKQALLVATTLARFRTTRAVIEGSYDVVLVDEVGAATVPEVILAVSRASRSALMLGDFMQLGAVTDPRLQQAQQPEVERWLLGDVFEHCGITTSERAQTHTGCTALDRQHRFGDAVMRLANTIAYNGLLKPGKAIKPRPPEDPEIVVIDVDDLGDLAHVRPTSARAGWWPAGALLSRVLADYHLHPERREVVGVVTPYRHQVEATLEAFRDREGADTPQVEVGTAHRFQGREFPVVVFDLVEDGFGDRWMASARLDKGSWERSGVRLFNVAVTRTQTRIYLIASRRKLEAAAPGTPLAAVNGLIRERSARVVPASWLVTPPSTPAEQRPTMGPFSSELAEVLAQHVTISDVQDERDFYRAFEEHLGKARTSVWIWAAWTASRVRSILPFLAEASARGVTIRVFVRDDSDKLQQREDFQGHLAALREVVSSVIAVNAMHQKIVVIDEQQVLLGSLNVLSQQWSREVMLVMDGHHFARKILEHEHADDFAKPPRCGACGTDDVSLRRDRNGRWYWRCSSHACPARRGSRAWTENALPDKRPPAKAKSSRSQPYGRGSA